MSEPKEKRLAWVATVGSEGGPVMVVDLPGVAQWTGSIPFTALFEQEPERREQLVNRTRTLHYWGQFTDQLPAPFTAEGGHQFVTCATAAEARAKLVELREAITRKFPGVQVHGEGEALQFILADTKARLLAELSPASEYDASWQANRGAESWLHAFGRDAQALFWDTEGAGVVDVGVSNDGTEVVLLRSWLSGNVESQRDEAAAVRAHVDSKSRREQPAGDLVTSTGKLAVVWSPVAALELDGIHSAEDLVKLGDGEMPKSLDSKGMRRIGALLRVRPGRYTITVALTEDDGDDDDTRPWPCRWCRLTWMGEA